MSNEFMNAIAVYSYLSRFFEVEVRKSELILYRKGHLWVLLRRVDRSDPDAFLKVLRASKCPYCHGDTFNMNVDGPYVCKPCDGEGHWALGHKFQVL